MSIRRILLLVLTVSVLPVYGQRFSLVQENDSLAFVVLSTEQGDDRWRLPYVVYRFCTGDVNGDGQEEALVGVIKPTRFYPQPGRRIFIFKNHRADPERGQTRPGSRIQRP